MSSQSGSEMRMTQVSLGETSAVSDPEAAFAVPPPPPKKHYDFLSPPLAALREGKVDRAIRMLRELEVVHPEIVELPYHLGRALHEAGRLDEARAYYRVVADDTDHPYSSHAVGRLGELGDPMGAEPAPVLIPEAAPVEAAPEPTPVEAAPVTAAPEPAPVEAAPVEAAPEPAPAEAAPAEAAPAEAALDTSDEAADDAPAEAGEDAGSAKGKAKTKAKGKAK